MIVATDMRAAAKPEAGVKEGDRPWDGPFPWRARYAASHVLMLPRRLRCCGPLATAALCLFAFFTITERRAHACGAAYPGGPMVCTLADAPKKKTATGEADSSVTAPRRQEAPIARVSASWSYTSTTILFGQGRRAELTRHTVFVGTELPLAPGFGLRFGAGGIVDGEITPHLNFGSGTGYPSASFGPGVSGFLGAAKTIIDERAEVPSVQLGATLSVSRATTRGPAPNEGPSFTAFDLRASATVGKTLGGIVIPYVTARAFGGPIYYRYGGQKVTGTDLYKYQVAGGFAVSLPSHVLDVFVEGVPLGESGVSAGLGTTF